MKRKRAFTLIELLVVIAIIALLVSLLLPALAKAQQNARTVKDMTQLKQIHQAMLIFANDNRESLPLPGKINRLADESTLVETPGVGPEDKAKNESRHLFSCMIAKSFFNPDILIGPTEVGSYVVEDLNYDYSAYRPANDIYWDGDDTGQGAEMPEYASITSTSGHFSANLDGVSNTSYFHLALCGNRKQAKWRNTQSAEDPILSTRGTRNGSFGNDLYTKSPTLLLHGADQQWVGNVVFNDNHAMTLDNFFPPLTSYEEVDQIGPKKDNIFAAEFDDHDDVGGGPSGHASGDAFLIMCTDTDADGQFVTPVWDPLP